MPILAKTNASYALTLVGLDVHHLGSVPALRARLDANPSRTGKFHGGFHIGKSLSKLCFSLEIDIILGRRIRVLFRRGFLQICRNAVCQTLSCLGSKVRGCQCSFILCIGHKAHFNDRGRNTCPVCARHGISLPYLKRVYPRACAERFQHSIGKRTAFLINTCVIGIGRCLTYRHGTLDCRICITIGMDADIDVRTDAVGKTRTLCIADLYLGSFTHHHHGIPLGNQYVAQSKRHAQIELMLGKPRQSSLRTCSHLGFFLVRTRADRLGIAHPTCLMPRIDHNDVLRILPAAAICDGSTGVCITRIRDKRNPPDIVALLLGCFLVLYLRFRFRNALRRRLGSCLCFELTFSLSRRFW